MFQSQLKKDAKLNDYLINPSIKKNIKVEAIKAAAKQTNMSAPVTNLLSELITLCKLIALLSFIF